MSPDIRPIDALTTLVGTRYIKHPLRVIKCPGMTGTVPESQVVSRVLSRSNPGQLSVPE